MAPINSRSPIVKLEGKYLVEFNYIVECLAKNDQTLEDLFAEPQSQGQLSLWKRSTIDNSISKRHVLGMLKDGSIEEFANRVVELCQKRDVSESSSIEAEWARCVRGLSIIVIPRRAALRPQFYHGRFAVLLYVFQDLVSHPADSRFVYHIQTGAGAKQGRKRIISKENSQPKRMKPSGGGELAIQTAGLCSGSSKSSSAGGVTVGILSSPGDRRGGKERSGMLIPLACYNPINTLTGAKSIAQFNLLNTQLQNLAQRNFTLSENTHSAIQTRLSDLVSLHHQTKLESGKCQTQLNDMNVKVAGQCAKMEELSDANAKLAQNYRAMSEELARTVEEKNASEQDLHSSTAKLKELQQAQGVLSLESEAKTAELEQALRELDHEEYCRTWSVPDRISRLVTSKEQLSDLLNEARIAVGASENEIVELRENARDSTETTKQQQLKISELETILEAKDKEIEHLEERERKAVVAITSLESKSTEDKQRCSRIETELQDAKKERETEAKKCAASSADLESISRQSENEKAAWNRLLKAESRIARLLTDKYELMEENNRIQLDMDQSGGTNVLAEKIKILESEKAELEKERRDLKAINKQYEAEGKIRRKNGQGASMSNVSEGELTELQEKKLDLAGARAALYRSVSLGAQVLSRHKVLVAQSMAMASDPKVKGMHLEKAEELMREAEGVRDLMYDFGLLRRDSARKQEEAGRAKADSSSARNGKCAVEEDAEDDDEEDWD
ncbi:MAG: hypothetical protein Q9157_007743 [Trypethelium eluteriae]